MGFHVEHEPPASSSQTTGTYHHSGFCSRWTELFPLTLKSFLSGVCCLSSHSLNSILSTAFTLSNNQLTSYCCFSYHGVSLILNTVGVLCVSGLVVCWVDGGLRSVCALTFSTPTAFSTIALTVCFAVLLLPFSQRSEGFVSWVCLGTVLLTSKLHRQIVIYFYWILLYT